MGQPNSARDLIRQVRRLDEYELRRLLIVTRGLLVGVDGQPDDEPGLPPNLTYRQEHVRCGKEHCSTCPHGPYWYAYWKEEGRTRKRYVGRHLPGDPLEQVEPDLAPGRQRRGAGSTSAREGSRAGGEDDGAGESSAPS